MRSSTEVHDEDAAARCTWHRSPNETRVVDIVETRIVEERETENGALVEVSRNFYAISRRTNSVVYVGEEVDMYERGKVVSHEGAWVSGASRAHCGLMMPGASDLYALAATLLHLMTGRAPREFMNEEGRLWVPDTLPGDTRLRPVIERLLRPSPTERFDSANEVRRALLSPSAVVAAQPQTPVSRAAARRTTKPIALGPTPRTMDGETAALYRSLAPSTLQLMDSSAKPGDEAGVADIIAVVLFSIVTAGILPLVFFSISRARRRRIRRVLRDGLPATAEIFRIEFESIPFDEKLARVSYSFEVDGAMHRDSDQVLPIIANRWLAGDGADSLHRGACVRQGDREYVRWGGGRGEQPCADSFTATGRIEEGQLINGKKVPAGSSMAESCELVTESGTATAV